MFDKEMTNQIVQAAVINALDEQGPKLLATMVKELLERKVDPANGSTKTYGDKVPFIEYCFNKQLDYAVENAIIGWFRNHKDEMEKQINKSLSSNSLVTSLTDALIKAVSDGFLKINVDIKLPQE